MDQNTGAHKWIRAITQWQALITDLSRRILACTRTRPPQTSREGKAALTLICMLFAAPRPHGQKDGFSPFLCMRVGKHTTLGKFRYQQALVCKLRACHFTANPPIHIPDTKAFAFRQADIFSWGRGRKLAYLVSDDESARIFWNVKLIFVGICWL
jgi:hypothetical protein